MQGCFWRWSPTLSSKDTSFRSQRCPFKPYWKIQLQYRVTKRDHALIVKRKYLRVALKSQDGKAENTTYHNRYITTNFRKWISACTNRKASDQYCILSCCEVFRSIALKRGIYRKERWTYSTRRGCCSRRFKPCWCCKVFCNSSMDK